MSTYLPTYYQPQPTYITNVQPTYMFRSLDTTSLGGLPPTLDTYVHK
jgi:hypothetical protein